ncbi:MULTISPECIES: DUF4234 domain-containing protein [Aminobacterium]|jgi:hypothetical protein|uniref:DUF4234 domain-containing protein n=1 Tax=Aminobacterium TaxID=81466 RepID=UPI00257D4F7B|nr:DUF4234 domain-containing protein [Aminobacterium sp. UBA4987]
MAADTVERELSCVSCGAVNEPGSKYCAYCGTLLQVKHIFPAVEKAKVSFKRVSVGFVLFLTIVTLGFYQALWAFFRRKAFNQLNVSERISDWFALMPLVLLVASFAVSGNESDLERILGIATWILWIVLAFKMRRMLREYVAGFADKDFLLNVAPSSVMTFFFTFFYIQYHINRLIDIGVFKRAN